MESNSQNTSVCSIPQQAMAKRTWFRNFLMHGFHFAVMMVVGSSIKDTQCGFKVWGMAWEEIQCCDVSIVHTDGHSACSAPVVHQPAPAALVF